MTTYKHLFAEVHGQGSPPALFLDTLLQFGRTAPDSLFASNDEPCDVMGLLCKLLGPWQGKEGSALWLMHRRCAMLELLRVLAGFEASWHWNEGVDTTNHRSMAHPECQEAGVFQESYDSMANEHGHHTLKDFLAANGVTDAASFIIKSKQDHMFELGYTLRLLRITYKCNGPILRGEVATNLSKEAVAEAMTILSAA